MSHTYLEGHTPKHRALVIPVNGPVQEVILLDGETADSLRQLQELVGGYIEALPVPDVVKGWTQATCYINEEGKLEGLEFNPRATDFMVPGYGLFFGDYIAGTMVVCGFDPETGENIGIPDAVAARVRLIEEEAA